MPHIIGVDVVTAKKWVDDDAVILIDVREVAELKKSRIQGALHNPMSNFAPDAIPKDTGKKIIFFCAGGTRSMQVGQNLINEHNLSKAYTMVGGTVAWAEAGLPFEHD